MRDKLSSRLRKNYHLPIVPQFHSTTHTTGRAASRYIAWLLNRSCNLGIVSVRRATVVMLKASLILLAGLGMGHSMLCSGHDFVTVDGNGSIVSDVSESWEHDHCVPVSSPVTRLTRTWGNSRHPHIVAFSHDMQGNACPAYAVTISFNHARAPPLS